MAKLNRRDYYSAIPQLEESITNLDKYITVSEGEIQVQIEDLYDNVSTITQTAEEIEARVEDAEGNITTLTATAEGLTTSVTSVTETVNTLSETVSTLDSDLDTVSSDLSSLTTRVTTAETSITENAEAITLKANSSDVYTSTETDDLLAEYTKTSVFTVAPDSILSTVEAAITTAEEYSDSQLSNSLASYYTKTEVDQTAESINTTISTVSETLDGEIEDRTTLIRDYSGGTITAYVGETYGVYTNASGSVDIVTLTWTDDVPSIDTTLATYGTETVIYTSDGTELAYFGYDSVSGDTSATAPYYTFGVRSSTSTDAIGVYSFSEGYGTKASGDYSHSEGYSSNAGTCSHAEGYSTSASSYSHAEGMNTTASENSHAEGIDTYAYGASHAEGNNCSATGAVSHAQNYFTVADQEYQTAVGKYNTESNTNNLFVVGNGTSPSARADAFTVSSGGVAAFGDVSTTFYRYSHSFTISSISSDSTSGATSQTFSMSGYYPVGIVGSKTGGGKVIFARMEITSASSGSCTIYYNAYNAASSASGSLSASVDILWVKEA